MIDKSFPRRVILSRKGFDQAVGGCASPIIDGQLVSLPIPECSSATGMFDHVTYDQLGELLPGVKAAEVVESLTKGKILGSHCVHLDPDLRVELRSPRAHAISRGTFIFGQSGAAQAELKDIEVGDLFLFFGWFRRAERKRTGWRFVPGAPDEHHLWGWLQVGRKLLVDDVDKAMRDGDIDQRHTHHPHVSHPHGRKNNVIYEATAKLSFQSGFAGAGIFPDANDNTLLTNPQGGSRSKWRLPSFFRNIEIGRFKLADKYGYWTLSESGDYIVSSAKRCKGCGASSRGQEFVFELDGNEDNLQRWLESKFESARAKH